MNQKNTNQKNTDRKIRIRNTPDTDKFHAVIEREHLPEMGYYL